MELFNYDGKGNKKKIMYCGLEMFNLVVEVIIDI